MSSNEQSSIGSKPELDQPLIDDIKNLYIGQISQAKGIGQTSVGPLEAMFQGEVLIYGQVEGDRFIIDQVRRVAIYGRDSYRGADRQIGVLSLAGPLVAPEIRRSGEGQVERRSGAGQAEPEQVELLLQLHYAALSSELDPLYKSTDAIFPQVEQAIARLTWKQQSAADDRSVQMELTFELIALVEAEKKLGMVQALSLDPFTVSFNRAGTGAPRPEPHFSLSSNCPAPNTPCGPNTETVTRILPIKFVSFSQTRDINDPTNGFEQKAALEKICQDQIDGVCLVWRNKAALDLTVTALVQGTPDQRRDFSNCSSNDEAELPFDLPAPDNGSSLDGINEVEIYLVDNLVTLEHGGGVAYNCCQASAYCILDLEVARQNQFLLSHELGHVLGLDHPGTSTCYPGSSGSVMQPTGTGAGLIISNPNINTQFNCRIFTAASSSNCPLTLNSIVTTTTTPDCFRLDA
jgi:hypothetical protein